MSHNSDKTMFGVKERACDGARQPTDKAWAYAFWVSVSAAAAAGTYTWLNRSPLYYSYDGVTDSGLIQELARAMARDSSGDVFLQEVASCMDEDGSVGTESSSELPLLSNFLNAAQRDNGGSSNGVSEHSILSKFLSAQLAPVELTDHSLDDGRSIASALLTSFVVAALPSFALVPLYQRAAMFMAHGWLVTLFTINATLAVALYATGDKALGAVAALASVLATGLFAWWMQTGRGRMQLAARLLAIASQSFQHNAHLLSVSLGLFVAANAASVPGIFGVLGALRNGQNVPNPEVAHPVPGSALCLDGQFGTVSCYLWKTSTIGLLVAGLVCAVTAWAVLVILQILTSTLAGTIARWHFAGESQGATLRWLCRATAANFGSNCAAAAAFPIAAVLVACGTSFRGAAPQFATTQMAVTGEAFWPAARSVDSLLSRHSLKPSPLQTTSLHSSVTFLSSVAVATVYACGCVLVLEHLSGSSHRDVYAVAADGAFWVLLSLIIVAGLLNAAADTLFVCYAHDLDRGTVSNRDVYDVFADLHQLAGTAGSKPDTDGLCGAA